MADTIEKKGRDIVPGDRVETDDGVRKVETAGRGMINGHRLLTWRGGWGHVPNDATVEVLGR